MLMLMLAAYALLSLACVLTLVWIAWSDTHPGRSLWRAVFRHGRIL